MAVTLTLTAVDLWRIKAAVQSTIGALYADEHMDEIDGFKQTLRKLDEALPPRRQTQPAPTPSAAGGPRPTERQLQMLAMAARGMTHREISRHMHLSDMTVKTHMANAVKRMRAVSRTHAVAIALANGWITLEDE